MQPNWFIYLDSRLAYRR